MAYIPKTYKIKTIDDISEIEKGCKVSVDVYNWGGDYRPVTKATLCYVKNQGFAVRMTCEEKNPRATFTQPNARVCRDSCLEFYADFKPEMKDKGYVNFECNASGTMLCYYGPATEYEYDGPHRLGDRAPVKEMGYDHPVPRVIRTEKYWGWELLVPLTLIRNLYGSADYKAGDHIRGNFYKCGDLTEHRHYASFTKIDLPKPNFMHPEFFADMIIVD
jgi:hypothetical protein